VHFKQKRLFLNYFSKVQNARAHSQLLFWLSQCLKVEAGVFQKRNHVFFLHLAALEGLFHKEEKKKKSARAGSTPEYMC
jgi:hypothetical protein